VLLVERAPSGDDIDNLLRQLEVGIPADSLDLLYLPVALTRGEHLALYQHGIKVQVDFWNTSADVIVDILGPTRAELIKSMRPVGE